MNPMKAAVIGDEASVGIYRPLGFEVFSVTSPSDAREIWPTLLQGGYAVVLVVERVYEAIAFFLEIYESTGVRAFVHCDQHLTQKDINDIARDGLHFMRSDGFEGICVGIFCSLTQVPRNRIEAALRLFTRADATCYYYEKDMVFFVHPVTSISKLGEMLEKSHIPISA